MVKKGKNVEKPKTSTQNNTSPDTIVIVFGQFSYKNVYLLEKPRIS